jgi:hypothetical protein
LPSRSQRRPSPTPFRKQTPPGPQFRHRRPNAGRVSSIRNRLARCTHIPVIRHPRRHQSGHQADHPKVWPFSLWRTSPRRPIAIEWCQTRPELCECPHKGVLPWLKNPGLIGLALNNRVRNSRMKRPMTALETTLDELRRLRVCRTHLDTAIESLEHFQLLRKKCSPVPATASHKTEVAGEVGLAAELSGGLRPDPRERWASQESKTHPGRGIVRPFIWPPTRAPVRRVLPNGCTHVGGYHLTMTPWPSTMAGPRSRRA